MILFILAALMSLEVHSAQVEVKVYKDKTCRKLGKTMSVELDKMFCEKDYMIGKIHMINCLSRGISVVWAQYGDANCKKAPNKPEGGSQEFDPDKKCHLDKTTNTYRSYSFTFNTEGAFCQYQKCLSDCQREKNCKKKCHTDFRNKL